MKKLPYFAGVILQILSLLLMLLSSFPLGGVFTAFGHWFYSVLLFIPILICYLIDGSITIYRGCKYYHHKRKLFGTAKLLITVAGIPLWFCFGGTLRTQEILIWNIYCILLLALQLLSQFLLRKDEV